MRYCARAAVWSAVLMLLGSGIWANVSNNSFMETRGMWVAQAMRGMGAY